MGGLLSAEVVLLPPRGPASFVGEAFRHRILGIINFDVPFLGMHPGIISAGLSSIFNPAEKSPERDSHLNTPSTHSSVSTLDLGPPLHNDTLFSSNPNDPNYNPRFDNDVVLPMRKGWQNALHFIQKHSDGLVEASKQLVKSHLEFGGTMADYPGLKRRYTRVRALEEEDVAKRKTAVADAGRNPEWVPRVRFVNFYTASTGRPKKPKTPQPGVASTDFGMSDLSLATSSQGLHSTRSLSDSISPQISIEEQGDDAGSDDETSHEPEELELIPPTPISDHELTPTPSLNHEPSVLSQESSAPASVSLPEIPPPPVEPTPPDLSSCSDEGARKAVTKEHEQALKKYKRAVKDRNNAIKEQAKAEEKQAKEAKKEEKRAQKAKEKEKKDREKKVEAETQKEGEELRLEQEKLRLEAESQRMAEGERERLRVQRKMLGLPPEEDDIAEPAQQEQPDVKPEIAHEDQPEEPAASHRRPASLAPSLSQSPSPSPAPSHARRTSSHTTTRSTPLSPSGGQDTPGKPKKDRRFCVLPSNDPRTGKLDPAWVRVFMEGMDEVGAHCGLFFISETYERLVGEVADTIEHWVMDDVNERAVKELESQIY